MVYYGLEEAQRLSILRRSVRRLYLTRLDLLLDPCTDTPWQVLYHSQNDRGFITTMGFDVGGKITVAWAACLRQVIIKAFWHRDPKVSGNENVSEKSVYI